MQAQKNCFAVLQIVCFVNSFPEVWDVSKALTSGPVLHLLGIALVSIFKKHHSLLSPIPRAKYLMVGVIWLT